MTKQSQPIGMFDSGLGGLTVMQKLVSKLPYEDIIYFGDTARLPYGGKSSETIVRYSIENATFLIDKNIKILVVACNTATSQALDKLQQMFALPVVGVIDPSAEQAVKVSTHHRIAVLGTKKTIQSGAYQRAILQHAPKATVFPIACPLFVPLVEEGCIDHPAARLIVQEYLRPVKGQRVDTILLGCTHYPILKDLIQEEVGDQVTLVDSGSACADKISALLDRMDMKKKPTPPSYQYFVSDDPHQFQRLGSAFLGFPIKDVTQQIS